MVRWIQPAAKRRLRKPDPAYYQWFAVAPPGLDTLRGWPKARKSLTLGLTLTAATELVEGSRPESNSYD